MADYLSLSEASLPSPGGELPPGEWARRVVMMPSSSAAVEALELLARIADQVGTESPAKAGRVANLRPAAPTSGVVA